MDLRPFTKFSLTPKQKVALCDRVLAHAAWDESKHPRAPAGSEKGGEFAPSLNDVLIDRDHALASYGQNTAYLINGRLRGRTEGAFKQTDPLIRSMDVAFATPKANQVVGEKKYVYRFVQNDGVHRAFGRARVGTVVEDKAFLSTSFNRSLIERVGGQMDKGVVLEIELPKGTKYLSGRQDEREAILDRSTRLKITQLDKGPDVTYASVRVVGKGNAKKYAEDEDYMLLTLSPPYDDEETQHQHSQIDYGRLKSLLSRMDRDAVGQIAAAISTAKAALLEYVRTAFDAKTTSMDWVGKLQIRNWADVRTAFREMSRTAFSAGRRDLRREVSGVVAMAEWDEAKHPRRAAGSDKGGEFAPVGGGWQPSAKDINAPDGTKADFDHVKGGLLFHGTAEPERISFGKMSDNEIYLTDHYGEAQQYSLGVHLGGRGSKPAVVLLQARPGRMLNADREVNRIIIEGDDLDFKTLFDKARKAGYSYVSYYHPSNFHGKQEQRVIVSLNPKLDLSYRKVWLTREDARQFSYAQIDYATPITPVRAANFMDERMFWVSGVLRDDLTRRAQGVLVQALKLGEPLDDTLGKLADTFAPYILEGVAPEVVSPFRLETIVRTNLTEAYNQGRLEELQDPALALYVEGVRYSAIMDERTTPVCQFLHDKVFHEDDPDLGRIAPPNHFNCRSILVPVIVGEDIEEYAGQAEIDEALSMIKASFGGDAPEYAERAALPRIYKEKPHEQSQAD